jgi:AraC-like DNA-binding protein
VLTTPFPARPFKWGDFSEFVETATFGSEAIELRRGGKGTEFGRVEIAPSDGEGTIEYLNSDLLRVLVFDCEFRRGRTFHVIDDGWVRMNFSLSITVDMAFGARDAVNILSPSWRFVSVPPDELTVENVAAGSVLKWVTVCCRPEMLAELADALPDDLPLRDMTQNQDIDGFSYRPFKLTPALKEATADVIRVHPPGGLRAAYVAAKAQELLVLGLEHLLHQQGPDALSQQIKLTERDMAALQLARTILDRDFAHPPTVAQLALTIGLNRNKLYYGFKKLFGVSISEHLQERRIREAYDLLTQTDEPISEIAAQIGFRHQCNFSTAFRAHYGVTPSHLRSREAKAVKTND